MSAARRAHPTTRTVARLGCSQLLANTGDALVRSTISLWVVAHTTGAASQLATILSAGAVTTLIAGVFAGAAIDRSSPVRALQVAYLGRAVACGGLLWVLTHPQDSAGGTLWPVVALTVVLAVCDAVDVPAASSCTAAATRGLRRVRWLGWLQTTALIGGMIGPAVAGVGAARGRWAAVLVGCGACFLAASVCLPRIVVAHHTRSASWWAQWRDGVRLVAAVPAYRALLPFGLGEALSASGVAVVWVLFITDRFGAAWFGLLGLVLMGGYAAGLLLAPRAGAWVSFAPLVGATNLVVAVCLAASALWPQLPLLVVATALRGMAQGALSPNFQALFLAAVPGDRVAQAMGLFSAVVGAVGAASYHGWASITDATSTQAALVGVAALHLAMGVGARALRRATASAGPPTPATG
ncbi:hypothetical protein C1Y63_02090 [Corynebacterium sp. 13CS0277]|uniref:MFS transporter n=1 Tax=Corynebacterium sp. 13CS0277 TaxID=2071994 RepID=UPI000D032328|nr:MFS transporter [Corynebacterium sp. 13CS0277]PRQ12126.1 hypothetical protein C1Y63_02090 [Corynebacterium sp. 13CS0277]